MGSEIHLRVVTQPHIVQIMKEKSERRLTEMTLDIGEVPWSAFVGMKEEHWCPRLHVLMDLLLNEDWHLTDTDSLGGKHVTWAPESAVTSRTDLANSTLCASAVVTAVSRHQHIFICVRTHSKLHWPFLFFDGTQNISGLASDVRDRRWMLARSCKITAVTASYCTWTTDGIMLSLSVLEADPQQMLNR